eukprot:scaffold614_cov367-Prasinococcus_capsulatus_cf.AAC.10
MAKHRIRGIEGGAGGPDTGARVRVRGLGLIRRWVEVGIARGRTATRRRWRRSRARYLGGVSARAVGVARRGGTRHKGRRRAVGPRETTRGRPPCGRSGATPGACVWPRVIQHSLLREVGNASRRRLIPGLLHARWLCLDGEPRN